MRNIIIGLCMLVASLGYAGPGDLVFDSGNLTNGQAYSETKLQQSGFIEQIDVSVGGTGAVSVAITTASTSGARVAKSIFSLSSTAASGSYPIRIAPFNITGGTWTSNSLARIALASDAIKCSVTNLNSAVTNGVRITIIRSNWE